MSREGYKYFLTCCSLMKNEGKYLRECMNTECSARFYRVDPITFEASVLNNGHRGPVKHVILKKTLNKKKKK